MAFKFKGNLVDVAITFFIGITILFQLVASFIPEAQDSLEQLSVQGPCENSGYYFNETTETCLTNSSATGIAATVPANKTTPLASLFGQNGVIMLIIMAGLLLLVARSSRSKR